MEISKEFIEGRLLEVIEKNIHSLFSRRGKDYDEMSKPLKVLSFSFDEELSVLSLKLNMKAVPFPENMFFLYENQIYCIKKFENIWESKKVYRGSDTQQLYIEKFEDETILNVTDKHFLHYASIDEETEERIIKVQEKYFTDEYSKLLEKNLDNTISFKAFKKEDIIKNKGRHLMYDETCHKFKEILKLKESFKENPTNSYFYKQDEIFICSLEATLIFKLMGMFKIYKRGGLGLFEFEIITDYGKTIKNFSYEMIEEFKTEYLNYLKISLMYEKELKELSLLLSNEEVQDPTNITNYMNDFRRRDNLSRIICFSKDDVFDMVNYLNENINYVKKLFSHNRVDSGLFLYQFLNAALSHKILHKEFSVLDVKDVHIFIRKIRNELNEYMLNNVSKNKDLDRQIYKILSTAPINGF